MDAKLSSRFATVKFYNKDESGNIGNECTADEAKYFVLPGTNGKAVIIPTPNEKAWYKWLNRLTAAADGQFDDWTSTRHPVQQQYRTVPAELGVLDTSSFGTDVMLAHDPASGLWYEDYGTYRKPCDPERSQWHTQFNSILAGATIIMSTFGRKSNYLAVVVQNWAAGPGNVAVEAAEDIAASRVRNAMYEAKKVLVENGLAEPEEKATVEQAIKIRTTKGVEVDLLALPDGEYKIYDQKGQFLNTLDWATRDDLRPIFAAAWAPISKSRLTMLVDVNSVAPLS
jgi:hypothetical protein